MEGGVANWEQQESTGTIPPPISHHNGVLYNDCWYFYGGLVRNESNSVIYCLDMNNMFWSIVEAPKGPKERDDHSACA